MQRQINSLFQLCNIYDWARLLTVKKKTLQFRQHQQRRGGDEDDGEQRQREQHPWQSGHGCLHLHGAEQPGQQVQALWAEIPPGARTKGTQIWILRCWFFFFFSLSLFCEFTKGLREKIKLKDLFWRRNWPEVIYYPGSSWFFCLFSWICSEQTQRIETM